MKPERSEEVEVGFKNYRLGTVHSDVVGAFFVDKDLGHFYNSCNCYFYGGGKVGLQTRVVALCDVSCQIDRGVVSGDASDRPVFSCNSFRPRNNACFALGDKTVRMCTFTTFK